MDITERKRAEEQLLNQLNLTRTITDNLGEGVYSLDTDGRFTFVNSAAENMLGWHKEDLIGRPSHETIHFQRADGTPLSFEDCPLHSVLSSGTQIRGNDVFSRKDGSVFPIAYISSPIIINGVITGAVRGFQDITEQLEAEATIREREQLYHTTFDNAPVGIAHVDLNGRWKHVNQQLCDILGYSREELLNYTFQSITHADDVEADDRAFRQHLAGEIQRYACEKRYIRKDGSTVWVNLIVTLLRDTEGKPKYFIDVVQDITDRKKLEQNFLQAQKMEALGQLAGGIAHDFNNLLTAIIGYTEMLLERADESMGRGLREIKKAGDRAAALTRHLLAFSRKQVLQPKVLNINTLIADLSKMLRRLIGEDIEFVLSLGPDISRISADPGQIEQVLMNLVVNARDAMPRGGKLIIETRNVELYETFAREHSGARPGPHVQVAVSDTGMGIDAETQARIFEPFFTTKGVGKGTGLGLSTVYGIVSQSGGSLSVYSEVGSGSTFSVYLPSVNEKESPIPVTTQKPVSHGSETVLLVEDEAIVRTLTKQILEMNGYRVIDAANGEEALRLFRQYDGDIDLMITDIVMPLMSGRELADSVAQLCPEMQILFISGYTDEAVLRHGVLSADVPFLEKPFTPDILARKVREVLDS